MQIKYNNTHSVLHLWKSYGAKMLMNQTIQQNYFMQAPWSSQYVDCTKMELYFISVPRQPLFPFKMSENDCGARGGSMVS